MSGGLRLFAFWTSAAALAYTYFGYTAWLWLRARWFAHPVLRRPQQPLVSIVVVVRNEEQILERKLANLLSLDYPADRAEIIIVSDGSTDGTEAILRKYSGRPQITCVLNPLPRGKAAGLNDALSLARGEIVVFTDARQTSAPGAIRLLVESFADDSVGCVTGELLLRAPDAGHAPGLGVYWRLEKKLWELEAASNSAVGTTGSFYAARRHLLPRLPSGTILDDVFIPMDIARQGRRVLCDGRAQAWDQALFGPGQEWARKVRTLAGNYQLLKLQPWLLTGANPIRFEFVSHKLAKLGAPFFLLALLVSSALLAAPLYRLALILQIGFYALAAVGFLTKRNGSGSRIAHSAAMFVLLNAAAAAAFVSFVTGSRVAWKRESEGAPKERAVPEGDAA